MGNFSNYAENKALDHVLKVAAYTPAMNLYFSLHTADPTDAGTGAEVANSNNYARVLCNVWNAAAARLADNTGAVSFAQASGAWGTVTHWGIWDSGTYGAGNLIAYGAFTASKVIVSGNIFTIPAGGCDISVTSGVVSTFLANKILDHFLKTASYTPATNIKVAFSTADPTNDGSGLAEPVGNNYARTTCNVFDVAVNGATANTNIIDSPVASGNWGTITHVALFDDEATPNMLLFGTITPSQAVGANDNFEYAAGGLDITLD